MVVTESIGVPELLTVTVTAPGFGEMDPDRVTVEPKLTELEDRLREIVVVSANVTPKVTALLGIVN